MASLILTSVDDLLLTRPRSLNYLDLEELDERISIHGPPSLRVFSWSTSQYPLEISHQNPKICWYYPRLDCEGAGDIV